MKEELCHHRIDLPEIPGLGDRPEIEVWDSTLPKDQTPHLTLYTNGRDSETNYIHLTPLEARALASLLLMAADSQERRTKAAG